MLITTSRKPSQRTRTFCRGLERVFKARCVNRGKMSLRDVFLKAGEMKTNRVFVVSERDGNPNGMEVYLNGDLYATLRFTVDFSLPKGRMNKDEICIRCEVEDMDKLTSEIFSIPLEGGDSSQPDSHYQELLSDSQRRKIEYGQSDCNLMWIKPHPRKSTPVIEFIDAKGQPTGPRINLIQCKLREETDESSS